MDDYEKAHNLEGITILLAEDDQGLVDRVASLLCGEGATVETVRHLEAARTILQRAGRSAPQSDGQTPQHRDAGFASAIVDLMLPANAEDLATITSYEESLAGVTEVLLAEKDEEIKEDLRAERQQIMLRIDNLLDKRAGFEIADMTHASAIPLLLLTAVNNEGTRREGRRRWPEAKWLTKPVSAAGLLEEVYLLVRRRDGAR